MIDKNEIAIDVTELNKSFGTIHAVNNVSLKVKRGEIFGFLGPNGSGKTTTIRILCGLLTPDSGKGHCLGYDILTQAANIKALVGYMTQRFTFYEDMSVYENLDFIAKIFKVKERKNKINEILEKFNFMGRKNQLAGQLSGGLKQQLALAACLLHEPKLLLLDEPTAGVDPKMRRDFWDLINDLSQQGVTTLVSTHYMDEAERCTRLSYISAGKLLIEGGPQEIIQKSNLVAWDIRGTDLYHLSNELKKQKEIEQIVMFGNILHISGSDKSALNLLANKYQDDINYQWQATAPNLEDVFVSFAKR